MARVYVGQRLTGVELIGQYLAIVASLHLPAMLVREDERIAVIDPSLIQVLQF